MKKINIPENMIKVLNRFRDIKLNTNNCYGKEFATNIFLMQAIEETKYKKLGMKEGDILFSLKPEQSMINLRNAMHGGSIGTGLDIITTIAMSGLHKDLCLNVTSKLSMNFVLPVSLVKNSYVLVTKANLLDNKLGFCEADMYDVDDIKLLVQHTSDLIEVIEDYLEVGLDTELIEEELTKENTNDTEKEKKDSENREWLTRTIVRTIIGLLFGFIGKRLYLAGFQQRLSILMGAVMIAIVLTPVSLFNKYNFSKPLYNPFVLL